MSPKTPILEVNQQRSSLAEMSLRCMLPNIPPSGPPRFAVAGLRALKNRNKIGGNGDPLEAVQLEGGRGAPRLSH
jgi:hypothetical protein